LPDKLDLTGDISEAINGAASRGNALVLGYVGDDGYAALSFRGSTQVFGPTQLALWARKADQGLAAVITERPQVSLLYYAAAGPGPKFLSIHGRARVDRSADDVVYANMIEGERQQDPQRAGVAVIIDVESLNGFGSQGQFQMLAERQDSPQ
jgi:hypothetical protein